MPPAALPKDERARLRALEAYALLDSPPERNLDDLVALTARILGTPIALVTLLGAERQWFKARFGLEVEHIPRAHAFCAHTILEPDGCLVVEDATQDPRFADSALVTGELELRFYAGVPLLTEAGHAIGTLCVLDTAPRRITADQIASLQDIARAVITTLDLWRVAEEHRRLALTDALTGLPNRPAMIRAVEQEIARQRRDRGRFGLLYIDLDGFRALSDRYGQTIGDAALREVADVLRHVIRRSDLPARLEGDKFAVLLTSNEPDRTQARAEAAAERLRVSIGARMAAQGWPVTASIGAIGFARLPADAQEALATAERVVGTAKAAGGNRVAGSAAPERSLNVA